MSKKPKFRPTITRVKLNPEQAVLACSCFSQGGAHSGVGSWASHRVGTTAFLCLAGASVKTVDVAYNCDGGKYRDGTEFRSSVASS